ncbi:MAG TPA: phosphate-starvation-inducible E-like protein [Nitrospirae bacterium]|nr:phosphate-starvation-inducible E [bacterium BMS3Abin10]GBE37789.1 phosphate-starvation-inducible E [bacterium BMS3Bbin08]HDH00891.1 phosphate-starvation-inducible E-like protein [Nitrospirota bacterium]HDH11536.1 phosphate-starvation-inducible E-like protein [Nitrospirota bacterium]
MLEYLKKFERIIITALIVMMTTVVFLSTVELGWIIIKDIMTPPVLLLQIAELLEIFGLFLLVLIGIELLEMIKIYLQKNVIHVEVVFMVAMIAVGRKVVILDVNELPSLTLIGIAAIILALSLGYYLIRRDKK